MTGARITVAALVVAALALAGCSAGSSTTSTNGASRKCAARIAIEGPFTGRVAEVGLEQLHLAQLAVAADNRANRTAVTLAHYDTQLSPSIAAARTQSIIASGAVATVGPASSQEVEAVGPLFGRAGMAFVSGSATLPSLATSGMNPTFFRVVPDDGIQGPQDADYVVAHLRPKAVLVIDDGTPYSLDLADLMMRVFERAHLRATHLSFDGTTTGASRASALSSLASAVRSPMKVVMLPWQSAADVQQFGLDLKQQGKRAILFGADGTDSPSQFKIPGSYVSAFGPDISTSNSALDRSIVSGVTRYGPYGPFGVPTYEATDVVMKAIAAVCNSGQTPNAADVLAAIRNTNIPGGANPLGVMVAFAHNGNLIGRDGYLFRIGATGRYTEVTGR